MPKPEGEKVEWSRTVNAGVEDAHRAITAIEKYNAQNLRAHRVSRWVHVVVSFPDGEKPTREQMAIIEDRLMQAIGFGDHPRLSAVHSNTRASPTGGYRHLHIAVTRLNPTTLKAEHPRLSQFRLQAAAARLELDLGLTQERKTLQLRERAEIDSRLSLDRAVDAHHERLEPDLEREMRGYFDALGRRGPEAAEAAGVTREAIMAGLVGLARMRPVGALWEPDENGTVAFITPVRVHPGNTAHDIESPYPKRAVRAGDIIDLIAWHPSRPDTWVLRTGEAVALGAIQYRLSDEPAADLKVRSSPLEWLRHGADGVVVLTNDPDLRRLVFNIDSQDIAERQDDSIGLAELDQRGPPTIQSDRREHSEKDRYPEPVPTLQQIARELSPEYDKLLRRADEITHKVIPKDEWVIRQQEGDLREAEHRLAERKNEIGWLRRALHTTHLWRDRELERWGPDFKARKEHTLWKWQAHRAAHLGEWNTLIRRADVAFEAIRHHAESMLSVRQTAHREKLAQQAREFLASTERVTINRRRSHTLRSGP